MTPTVGRIVHFKRTDSSTQPLAAIITYVHSADCVDLAVFESELAHVVGLHRVRFGEGELE